MSVRIVAHGSSRTADFRCETGATRMPDGGLAGAAVFPGGPAGHDLDGRGTHVTASAQTVTARTCRLTSFRARTLTLPDALESPCENLERPLTSGP
jgi:hypothetical protein